MSQVITKYKSLTMDPPNKSWWNHWNSKEKGREEGGGPNYNIEYKFPNNNNNETLNKNSNMGKGIW